MSDADPDIELRNLAARIIAAQGPGMFPAMAQYLAALLSANEVLIGEAADDLHARTLGVSVQGAAQPNYIFPLAGTPSEALLRASVEDGTDGQVDAQDPGSNDLDSAAPADDSTSAVPGYFGMALQDPTGRTIGFVCARSDRELALSEHQQCLIEIVSVLLSTELQLLHTERARAQLDGEVQELRSKLEALERSEISAAATGLHRAPGFSPQPLDLDDTESTGLHHVQREHILRVLNATRWVIEGNSGAALKLGMKPATLRHRMKKLGIARLRQQP